jgi:hypothetical protein
MGAAGICGASAVLDLGKAVKRMLFHQAEFSQHAVILNRVRVTAEFVVRGIAVSISRLEQDIVAPEIADGHAEEIAVIRIAGAVVYVPGTNLAVEGNSVKIILAFCAVEKAGSLVESASWPKV